MNAVVEQNIVDVVAVADADPMAREQALAAAPDAVAVTTLDEVLALEPEGVVLATPSAMHASQSIAALKRGVAVFCQKPLGRDATEVHDVLAAAREANRLLGVDVSYRHTEGLSRIRGLVHEGCIGRVFAVDLTFHNAYGPDKPWFYDIEQSGGGCLLDLGVHLVDFLYWTFDERTRRVAGQVFAAGERLQPQDRKVEDYATGEIEFESGAIARLACSWKLSAGCDAQIAVVLHGTDGGLAFRNVNGSFYDFVTECYRGTATEVLSRPPESWGGRATVAWAQQLARSPAYAPEIEIAGRVAETIDQLYGRASGRGGFGPHVDRKHATELSAHPHG